ncbi:MAG: stage II sporulation protein D [Thermoanaerobacteraceae bacterium]
MKYIVYAVLIIILSIVLLPSVIIFAFGPHKTDVNMKSSARVIYNGDVVKISENEDYNFINVFVDKQNKLEKMNLEEYIKGVVAAEMPAEFNIEALKAQAIAARTYALSKETYLGGKGCELHEGADICTDPEHCQAWQSEDELKVKWGKDYDKYHEKISKAVDETKGMVLVYDNALIIPAYHAISGGITENSEDVWKDKMPYLRSVLSPGEDSASKFRSQVIVSKDEFLNKLKIKEPSLKIKTENITGIISDIERTQAGHIKKLKIAGVNFTGKDIKELFNLNSTNFTISQQKDRIIINVLGYGHGVGMSQYGANAMAKAGNNYEKILKYYYSGVEIININDLLKNVKK